MLRKLNRLDDDEEAQIKEGRNLRKSSRNDFLYGYIDDFSIVAQPAAKRRKLNEEDADSDVGDDDFDLEKVILKIDESLTE